MMLRKKHESELIDWHHINDAYVVALPRDLHCLYGGKFHREKNYGNSKTILSSGLKMSLTVTGLSEVVRFNKNISNNKKV